MTLSKRRVTLGAGVRQHLVRQLDGPIEQVLGDLLELLSIELDPRLMPGVRDPERGLLALGQRLLAALRLQEQVIEDFGIIERVACLAGLGLELLGEVHHDRLVPQHATQPMVAAGADHPDQPVLDLDHRDVEGSAAQVVDQDGLVLALLEAVGDRGGRRLVQDRPHVQARQPAGVGRRLALGRPEVGGAGDHDVGDLVAQRDLGVAHDLAQDERRDVFGAVRLPLVLKDEIGIAHALLDPRDDPVGLDLGRLFGGVADDDVVAVEQDDRGRDPLTLLVGNDDGLSVLVDIRDRRVSRSQVDPVNALEAIRHGRNSRCSLVWLGWNDARPIQIATRHGVAPWRFDKDLRSGA